jgi:hypothetical protein
MTLILSSKNDLDLILEIVVIMFYLQNDSDKKDQN